MSSKNRHNKKHQDKKEEKKSFWQKFDAALSVKEKPDFEKTAFWILIGILAAGFIARVILLGDLWLNEDETYTMTAAKRLITGTGSPYNTSPLYILLQYVLFLVLGLNEFAARIPAVIFGVAGIGAIFYFVKKYVNTVTALFTAILMCVSFFEVYFSRTARPYTALQLSYIVLSWMFLSSFKSEITVGAPFFKSFLEFVSIKKFLIFLGLFLLSVLIHPWTVLFWVTLIFYFFVSFFYHLLTKSKAYEKYYYLLLAFLFILVVIGGWAVIELGLFTSLFQQKATIDVVVPDLARTYNFLKDDPFKGVLHYFNLFGYDFYYLWMAAAVGFVSSFFVIKEKRFLLFLHSMFFSNLIMLGFFIHVLQQRYFFPVYPFYLIFMGIGFYFIYTLLRRFILNTDSSAQKWVLIAVFTAGIFSAIPYKYFHNLYKMNMKINIYIDSDIGEYTFYPYRKACQYVQENIKPGEAVLCTMPRIAEFYIDRNIMALRQTKVNLNKFNVADEVVADTTLYPGQTINHRSFLNYISEHKSGWLIADARINTVLTPETRDFILNHFDFHFVGSNPLNVMLVGHWDSTTLASRQKYFYAFHEYLPTGSLPYRANIDPSAKIMLSLIYSGVEKENEAICSVGSMSSYLPPNLFLGKQDTADWIMDAGSLVNSKSIDFKYNVDSGDSLKGFMIHDLVVLLSRQP